MKRYDPSVDGSEYYGMVETQDGDYVLYEDAAKLESDNAALRAEVEALRRKLGGWEYKCPRCGEDIDPKANGCPCLLHADRLHRAAKGE